MIDRSEFKPLTPADIAEIKANTAANKPADAKASADAAKASGEAAPADKAAPDQTGGEAAAEAPVVPDKSEPKPAEAPKSLFATLFGASEEKPAEPVKPAEADKPATDTPPTDAKAATETPPADAPPTTGSDLEVAQAEAEADMVAAADDGEISEADLAGESEADPSKRAVPVDDGREHDFVNVYTSRPDKPTDLFENLPGVTWKGGLVLITPGVDGSGLFDGEVQPYARTIPGMPSGLMQASNGLLLAHAAINVGCVKPPLLNMVRDAESHFGHKVVVTSGYRSPSHNRQVRGAVHSQHLYCNALDLYMPGVARDDLARYFHGHPSRGGLGLYCHTKSIHVDTGRRREWRWSCKSRH